MELMCIIADVDHKRLVIIIQTKIIFIGIIDVFICCLLSLS